MRCPSCGTENAPDSRFCGECGFRLTGEQQRLAPTQKISDDATFPRHEIATAAAGRAQPSRGPSAPQSAVRPNTPQQVPHPALISTPPGYATPSNAQSKPPSKPPNGSAKSLSPAAVSAPAPGPSLSMPIPARRPWALIIILLVIDLGLAGAGAYLLSQGLSR